MSVKVTDIRVFNDFRSESVNLLLGNVFEHVKIEIDCELELFAIANVDQVIEAGTNVTNVLTDDWFFDDSGRFDGFQVGDTITVTLAGSNNGTYTILEVNGTQLIRVDSSLTASTHTTAKIVNDTVINGITLKTNFIENGEALTFRSKVDDSIQTFTIDNADSQSVALKDFTPLGLKDWQIGTAKVKGQAVVGLEAFTIEIDTFITPFFLTGQLNDLQNNTAPDYFLSQNTLKHVFEIDLHPDLTDLNRKFTVTVDDVLGNVGWLDENFNGFPTNYTIDSISHKLFSDSSPLSAVELTDTDKTVVDIVVKNTTDAPFIDWNVDPVNATKFVVNFALLPDDADDYQGRDRLLSRNFAFDYATNTAGNPTLSNGNNFGTSLQTLLCMGVTFTSSSEVTIQVVFDFGADVFADLLADGGRNYILTVNTQDSLLASSVADRVQLKAETNVLNQEIINNNLLTFSNRFLIHPENDIDDPQSEGTFIKEDLVTARTLVQLDNSNGEVITNIKASLIAFNSVTEDEFELESFSQSTPTTPIVSGGQFFDIASGRPFLIPAGEIRNNIIMKRRTDLDAAGKKAFLVAYPFYYRWEDWVLNTNVDSDFFDVAEKNNGQNQDWIRFKSGDWNVYYNLDVTVNDQGNVYTLSKRFLVNATDYLGNADWDSEVVVTKDADTLAPLLSGSDYFVLGYKDTQVEISFDYVGASLPALVDVWAVIRMETFEAGGISGITRLSSEYATDGNSFLKSIGATDKVDVSLVGSTFTLKCLVDHTKLPSNVEAFSITGRIGVKADPNCLLEEDGAQIFEENGVDCIEVEHV